ncbi:MAG: acyltransferase, partial [Dehalococcoidia bacterium]|nr:acyltransferase [Dehalococcoidia bacterium]
MVFALVGVRSLESLSLEAAGALAYVANWVFLLREQSYFETAASPSPFLHFWSLAVEGQFYLLWPLLMVVALRGGGRLTLFLLAISLAAISVVVGSSLYNPFGDPSRAYYGTDARAAGLLMGAALGVVARPGLVSAKRFLTRPVIEAIGWGGALVLAWLITKGSEFTPFTYQGGFLVASTATIAVMLAGLHARNSVSAILSVAPLRWIGLRSYSIYLCHWPVVVLTQPHMSSALQSWNLAVARFAATLILAEISYRLLEYRFRSPRRADTDTTTEAWWRHPAAAFVIARLPVRAATGLRSPWAPPAGVVAAGLLAILIAGGLPIRTGAVDARTSVAHFADQQLEADGVSVQFTATPALVTLATAEAPSQPYSPASQIVLSPSLTPDETPGSSNGVSSSVLGGEASPTAIGTVIPLEPDPAAEGVTLPGLVAVTAIGDTEMVGAVPALA